MEGASSRAMRADRQQGAAMNTERAVVASLALALISAVPAYAGVQASGANSIFPSDSTLVINQAITMDVKITNTSSNTEPPNTNPVPATLTGTTQVKLACANSLCSSELQGTLTFNSCDKVATGVDDCALDPSDPSGNTVLITMTSGVTLPASGVVTLVTIHVTATNPVLSPANGQF